MTYFFRLRSLVIVLLSIINISIAQTSNAKVTILSTMVADYDYLGEWGFAALIESDGNPIEGMSTITVAGLRVTVL